MARLHRAEPQRLIPAVSGGGVSLGDARLGAVHGRIEEDAHPFAPPLQ